jgi:hypothetical protein
VEKEIIIHAYGCKSDVRIGYEIRDPDDLIREIYRGMNSSCDPLTRKPILQASRNVTNKMMDEADWLSHCDSRHMCKYRACRLEQSISQITHEISSTVQCDRVSRCACEAHFHFTRINLRSVHVKGISPNWCCGS